MTTNTPNRVDADGATITEGSESSWFSLPEIPLRFVVDVARMGVQFGIGVAALAVDAAQRLAVDAERLALEAIDRGAKIEKESLATLERLEREKVQSMKSYLNDMKGRAEKVSGSTIEAHVEEALKTHDVPTRDDLREIDQHLSRIEEQVSRRNE